ncbi:MAG TPA: translation initiation factor IF-3 [Pyrinomonadaceae bacterium]|nr:translation initiation factor IF-3 [Pyrinomonadaceae bacterium]
MTLGGVAIAGFRGRGQRFDNRRAPATRINERIRVPEVRVIAEDGEQLGVMQTRDAVRMARDKGLDLVEVAATADPPVCRIIDYGKFQYEAKKKANEAKKKQVTITVKEVKFRPGTDEHDYNFKMKHARQWLEEGDKVKATIFFRGREITHRELGAQLLERLEHDLTEFGEVEARPRMEGNQMFLVFAPKKQKSARQQDAGQQREQQPRREEATAPAQAAPAAPAATTPAATTPVVVEPSGQGEAQG